MKDLATGRARRPRSRDCTGDFAGRPTAATSSGPSATTTAAPTKIFRRPARGGEDTLVYEEPDDGLFLERRAKREPRIHPDLAGNGSQSEYLHHPRQRPDGGAALFSARETDMLYTPTHWNGRWYVLTNADGAVDFKVMTARAGRTARAQLARFLAHQPGRYILGLSATKDHLVRAGARQRAAAHRRPPRGGDEHAIALTEQAYNLELAGSYEFDTAGTALHL